MDVFTAVDADAMNSGSLYAEGIWPGVREGCEGFRACPRSRGSGSNVVQLFADGSVLVVGMVPVKHKPILLLIY